MKSIKLSMLALSVIALGLGSCSKDCEVKPASETNKSASALKDAVLNNAQATLTFSANPVVEGGALTITASHGPNDAGTMVLEENIAGIWTSMETDVYTIPAVTAADNGRVFRAYLLKDTGNDFYSTSVTLSVNTACTFSLTPNTTMVEVVNNVYKFTTTYTIQACDRAVNNIKLQGGLTSGATFIKAESTSGSTFKITGNGSGSNTVITWQGINMAANTSRSFTVVYTKPIACGVTQTITGNWSAKGVFVDDNTAALLGYNNQQSYTSVDCL